MFRSRSLPFFNSFLNVGRHYSASSSSACYDVVIVGGGIIGVATARELKKRANISIAVLEKESILASHQTGHNSGVIHAGIYYKPGSIRAKLCTLGMKRAYEYAHENNIPFKKVGKLIVATNSKEEPVLMDLYNRGLQNGVEDMKLLDAKGISKIEPYCVGTKAIHSPHTGIIDWGEFARALGKDFQECDGKVHFGFEVCEFDFESSKTDSCETSSKEKYPVTIYSKNGECVKAGFVLTCAGLYSDKIAELTGGSKTPAVLPVRGEYLILKPEKAHYVKGNIYPVPDPRFPFLGVHFTPKIDGTIIVGPNAVVATKREGYRYRDISIKEFTGSLMYPGFQRLALRYFSFGLNELLKSAFISLKVKDLQKFIPSICANDIMRGPSGVRAQALDPSGDFIDDFVFDEGTGPATNLILHCRNTPSPGATASLAIGEVLADKVLKIVKC